MGAPSIASKSSIGKDDVDVDGGGADEDASVLTVEGSEEGNDEECHAAADDDAEADVATSSVPLLMLLPLVVVLAILTPRSPCCSSTCPTKTSK